MNTDNIKHLICSDSKDSNEAPTPYLILSCHHVTHDVMVFTLWTGIFSITSRTKMKGIECCRLSSSWHFL